MAKSKLYAGNLIRGINAWAVSVVRYSAGVLDWTDKELKALDVRTRKLLTMFGVFHMRSSVDRLYMKRTTGHLASGCSKLAQREYKRRHDRMGLGVYWELCKKYGMKYSSRWYEEVPEAVRLSKDGNFELWWDRSVETTQKLDHNRPDIVLINRVKKEWLIVDFSVPSDVNVVGKEDEKIMRYSPLALDARKLHGVSTKVIPVVVGSFGVVSSRLAGFLRELGVGHTLGGLQTSAIIGTSIILKKVLCL